MTTFAVKVVQIKDVMAHPNADRLEIAQIDGWQCVVQKDTYKAGDVAIYIPIDSILPEKTETTLFGPDSKIKLSKSRVRTIKIRGAISQGMLAKCELFDVPVTVGYDCTADLGISKFEPPEPPASMRAQSGMSVSKKKKNENFKEYGGLDNFKHNPDLFQEGEHVIITEKIHGTNFRCGWVPTVANTRWKKFLQFIRLLPKMEFVFGSNRVQLQNKMFYKGYYKTNVYANMVVQAGLKELLEQFPNHVIYGEIYGEGIQKGYNYGCKNEQKLVIFDVMVNGEYADHEYLEELVTMRLNLKMPPILFDGPYNAETAKALTKGDSVLCPQQKVREGVVIRPIKETKCHIGRKVLKLISDEYLLKDDNTDFH